MCRSYTITSAAHSISIPCSWKMLHHLIGLKQPSNSIIVFVNFLFKCRLKTNTHIRVLTPLLTYRFLYLSCFGSIAYMYVLSNICIYRPYGIVAHSVGHYQWRASSEIKRSSAALAWTCQLEMQHDSPRFVMEVQTYLSSFHKNVVTGTKHHLFSIRFIMCVCQAYVKGKMLRHR